MASADVLVAVLEEGREKQARHQHNHMCHVNPGASTIWGTYNIGL